MNFSKLDTFMQAMPARGIPGCELAVAKDGKMTLTSRPIAGADAEYLELINAGGKKPFHAPVN